MVILDFSIDNISRKVGQHIFEKSQSKMDKSHGA